MKFEDTIFQDDNAFLQLMSIIEDGKDNFVFAIDNQNVGSPAKISINGRGTFDITFKMPKNISSDIFFTNKFVLFTNALTIYIQNKDVKCNKQQLVCKDGGFDNKLTINSFSTTTDNQLWNNSKQVAFCSYSVDSFNPHKVGVIFNLTTSTNQQSTWKNGVQLEINSSIFLLYFAGTNNNRKFIVLKSQQEVNHNFFLKVLESVKTAIGLLSGYYVADNAWYFSMQLHSKTTFAFRYENIDRTIYNNHPLLDYRNYIDCPESRHNLNSEQFNALVCLFYKSEAIQRAAHLLIQAGNIKGISKGCLASVALETIKNKIQTNKKEQSSLISNNDVKSRLHKDLFSTLNKFKKELGESIYSRLQSKLGQIDQQSNAEHLGMPFEQLGIELSEDEQFCLSCRNFFLHGSTIKPNGDFYTQLTETELVDIISNRLIMLTSILLLKKCGYRGKIIDWGLTEIVKWRAIYTSQNINNYGNALRNIEKPYYD